MNPVPLFVLALVIFLIAARRIGKVHFTIWQAMALGAMAVVFTGQISPPEALESINLDIMVFLFGMFVIGQALEESGYLETLAQKLFRRAKSVDNVVILILLGMGIGSAFLMNDTMAIVGTPLALTIASRNRLDQRMLLMALAFAVTIGSVFSPIGNPQNLLIAINAGIDEPFFTFARYLFLPTLVNLVIAYLWLRIVYKKSFGKQIEMTPRPVMTDMRLARLAKISLMLMALLIALKILLVVLAIDFDLAYIALISCMPILLLSRKRAQIIRNIDWGTLAFFASMFILMSAVWNSGAIQWAIMRMDLNILSIAVILVISVIFSQVLSNVPMVALYLPVMTGLGAGTGELMALAAGSTIAGNFMIIGAASNVIIIQGAEKRGKKAFGFLEFARIGIPLTIMNIIVYWLFLNFV